MTTRKLFPLSGIAFVALVVGAVVGIGGSTPDSNASAADVASFYDDNAVRQGIGAFVLAASVPFLVFFGIGLIRALAAQGSAWGRTLLAGNILTAAGVLTAAFVHFALVDGGDSGVSPTALQALNVLDGNTWMAFNPGLGVMMLGAAGALLSAGVLRWLGWIALVLGVVLFIPFADFFALLLTLVWIVVTGVALTRGGAKLGALAAAIVVALAVPSAALAAGGVAGTYTTTISRPQELKGKWLVTFAKNGTYKVWLNGKALARGTYSATTTTITLRETTGCGGTGIYGWKRSGRTMSFVRKREVHSCQARATVLAHRFTKVR